MDEFHRDIVAVKKSRQCGLTAAIEVAAAAPDMSTFTIKHADGTESAWESWGERDGDEPFDAQEYAARWKEQYKAAMGLGALPYGQSNARGLPIGYRMEQRMRSHRRLL